MPIKGLVSVLDEIRSLRWESRIVFSMHGDPSYHPSLVETLQLTRERLKNMNSIAVFTTGAGWRGRSLEMLDQVVRHGEPNCVALGDYGTGFAGRIRSGEYLALESLLPNLRVGEWPGPKWANPDRRFRSDERILSLCADPIRSKNVHNQSGNAYPETNYAEGRQCNLPHREMTIRWDGTVVVCENDMKGELIVGDVSIDGVEKTWRSAAYEAARSRLTAGDRSQRPCSGCDRLTTGRAARPALTDRLGGRV